MDDLKEIAVRFIKAREALGLNPRQFALKAKVDPSAYLKAEAGKPGLGKKKYMDISSEHGINLNWLLRGEGEMFTTPHLNTSYLDEFPPLVNRSSDPAGSRLAKLREKSGLSVRQFADSIGSDPFEYDRMEKGDVLITPEILSELSTKYGVNTNWLLTGEGEMFINNPQAGTESDNYRYIALQKYLSLVDKNMAMQEKIIALQEQVTSMNLNTQQQVNLLYQKYHDMRSTLIAINFTMKENFDAIMSHINHANADRDIQMKAIDSLKETCTQCLSRLEELAAENEDGKRDH